jgi:hypothetical protein
VRRAHRWPPAHSSVFLAKRSENVICENQLGVGRIEVGDNELQPTLSLADRFGDGARLTAEVDIVDGFALRDARRRETRFRECVSVCVNLRAVCH